MSNQPVYSHLSSKEEDELHLGEEGKQQDGDMMLKKDLIDKRPVINTIPNIHVGQMVAPASLPEGYELPVQVGLSKFNIQIPMGGVEEGQVFSVPIPQDGMNMTLPSSKTTAASVSPVGAWRDGICDCFKHGMCHSHCLTSAFCPLLAVGQVMSRLQFNWKCVPSNTRSATANAFAITSYITIFMWTMYAIYQVLFIALSPKENLFKFPVPQPEGVLLIVAEAYQKLYWIFLLVTFIFMFFLRRAVRGKFKIPGSCCEDFCCIFWCKCCVIGQMLRHTTDYDVYPGRVCSSTGLSERASPMNV